MISKHETILPTAHEDTKYNTALTLCFPYTAITRNIKTTDRVNLITLIILLQWHLSRVGIYLAASEHPLLGPDVAEAGEKGKRAFASCHRVSTSWTGCRFIAGLTRRDKKNIHAHFPLANFESPINLTSVSLDCGRKLECLEKPTQAHELHTQRLQTL